MCDGMPLSHLCVCIQIIIHDGYIIRRSENTSENPLLEVKCSYEDILNVKKADNITLFYDGPSIELRVSEVQYVADFLEVIFRTLQ